MAATVDVDPVLRQLHAGGFTALASDITGLQPQKTEATPDVLELQTRYARVPGSPVTSAFTGSLLIDAPLPEQPAVPVRVTFDVVQAPAAFCLPVMQKRPWDPPFQVRMTWRSSLPLQFTASVAAFVVDEAALPSMLNWQLPTPQDAAKQLGDHQQERVVMLTKGALRPDELEAEGGQWDHSAEAVFTFSRLQFGQPSQMRPRWLVFAGSLLGGGCVFSHYHLPTVVMSRLAEQFDKAKRVLWGCVEPVCDSSVIKMDYKQLRKYIKKELVAIGILREPSEDDYRYLAGRAGFVVSPEGVRGNSASLDELAAFRGWFGGHLVMLKHIRAHYERGEPQVVSGFSMTRERAEALLAPHPRGTFLLRFGSQGGLLVLSVRSGAAAPPCVHFSLQCGNLQANGLEALLERNGKAEQLLDATTGQRHLRTAVLDRSYLQAVDVAEARKRYRQSGGVGGSDEGESSPSAAPMAEAPLSGAAHSMLLGMQGLEAPGIAAFGRIDSLTSAGSQQAAAGPSGAFVHAPQQQQGADGRGDSQQRFASLQFPHSLLAAASASLNPYIHPGMALPVPAASPASVTTSAAAAAAGLAGWPGGAGGPDAASLLQQQAWFAQQARLGQPADSAWCSPGLVRLPNGDCHHVGTQPTALTSPHHYHYQQQQQQQQQQQAMWAGGMGALGGLAFQPPPGHHAGGLVTLPEPLTNSILNNGRQAGSAPAALGSPDTSPTASFSASGGSRASGSENVGAAPPGGDVMMAVGGGPDAMAALAAAAVGGSPAMLPLPAGGELPGMLMPPSALNGAGVAHGGGPGGAAPRMLVDSSTMLVSDLQELMLKQMSPRAAAAAGQMTTGEGGTHPGAHPGLGASADELQGIIDHFLY